MQFSTYDLMTYVPKLLTVEPRTKSKLLFLFHTLYSSEMSRRREIITGFQQTGLNHLKGEMYRDLDSFDKVYLI